jgi:hypothetical protein
MRCLDPGKHRTRSAASLNQNRQTNGSKHEEDRRPGCHFGQQVGCSPWTERGLGPLAAKRAGEIGTLALLEQNNTNQDDANNHVNRTDKPDHAEPQSNGAEGGT